MELNFKVTPETLSIKVAYGDCTFTGGLGMIVGNILDKIEEIHNKDLPEDQHLYFKRQSILDQQANFSMTLSGPGPEFNFPRTEEIVEKLHHELTVAMEFQMLINKHERLMKQIKSVK